MKILIKLLLIMFFVNAMLRVSLLNDNGGIRMNWDIEEKVIIGQTTYDEVLSIDPKAKIVMTSTGFITFHEKPNGGMLSIRFVYNAGQFIATEINGSHNGQ